MASTASRRASDLGPSGRPPAPTGAAQELHQSAPPAVAVLAQERRHPTLAEVGGRGRRGIALEEGEGDFAPHIGEQLAGTGPRCGEDRGQLVAGGDPCVDQVRSRPDGCPEGSRLGAERPKSAQIVVTQAQVVGDHLGVTGSLLAPEPTSASRHALIAVVLTGTTG